MPHKKSISDIVQDELQSFEMDANSSTFLAICWCCPGIVSNRLISVQALIDTWYMDDFTVLILLCFVAAHLKPFQQHSQHVQETMNASKSFAWLAVSSCEAWSNHTQCEAFLIECTKAQSFD